MKRVTSSQVWSLVFCLLFLGCGKKSASIFRINSLKKTPKATRKVVGSATKKIERTMQDLLPSRNFNLISLMSAQTGQTAAAFGNLSWSSTQSGPFCEAGNTTLMLLQNASIPDKLSCYMAAGETNNVFAIKYDGADHFLSFTNSGTTITPKVKYNGAKDGDGNISSFKMWMCFMSATQDTYTGMVNDGTTVTLTAVGVNSVAVDANTTVTFTERVVANGAVNADGDWDGSVGPKTINFSGTMNVPNAMTWNGNVAGSFYPDYETIAAYGTGSYGGVAQTESLYTQMQLLPLNYDLSNMAFGDGCTKFNFGFGGTTDTGTKCWYGDTRLPLADSTQGDSYANVNAQTLPTVSSVSAQSFGSGEAWDCTLGADTATIDMNAFNLSSGAAYTDTKACDATYPDDSAGENCSGAAY